jgi:hypothetical protein
MIAPNRHRNRGKEILGLLRRHGPLSADVLLRMTTPPMKKKKLLRSLSILHGRGLTESRRIGSAQTFYSISQALSSRDQVAVVLECQADDLLQPLLRRQDWIHNQWSEFWIHLLSHHFPEAEVVREQVIMKHEMAKRVLLASDTECDLLPDFLLIFPKDNLKRSVAVAFEIERTRKSNARIVRKLRKYANKTQVDGLVYICDSGRLSETIRGLYLESQASQAFRIKHYAENFFIFSDAINTNESPLERIFDATGKPISMVEWCMKLRSTKPTLRRNSISN